MACFGRVTVCLCVAAALCAAAAAASSDEHSAADPLFTLHDLKALRVKALRKMLRDRGVECVGCVEKGHLVDRVLETQHLPVRERVEEVPEPAAKKAPAAPGGTGAAGTPPGMADIMKQFKEQQQQQAEMKAKLKAQGIDLGDVSFGNNLSPEQMEMLAKAMSNNNNDKGSEL